MKMNGNKCIKNLFNPYIIHTRTIPKKNYSSSMNVQQSNIVDRDTFVNEFDISILENNWLPPGPQRTLLYSFHRLLSATDYRLDRMKKLNEGALSRLDAKLNDIDHHNDTGYFRLEKDLKTLDRQIRKFHKQSHRMLDKFENMENNVITQEFMQWIVEWPSPFTHRMILNNFPNFLCSPTYEIGPCLWHCQLRKVPFYRQKEMYWKMGIFVGPKQVTQMREVCALKCKLKVIVCIKYNERMRGDKHHRYSPNEIIFNRDVDGNVIEKIQVESDDVMEEESLEIKTNDIEFDVDTNFVKIDKDNDGEIRLMSWGKFIPELQDIMDEKTGTIPHESVKIEIKFRVVEQCVTYKQPRSVENEPKFE